MNTDLSKIIDLHQNSITRRQFFRKNAMGLGGAALASLLPQRLMGALSGESGITHFAPRAKRVIYLSMMGAPSQFETFDYKPKMKEMFGKNMKDFLIASGQTLTGMTAAQADFPVAPSFVDFKQYGESGTWVSDLLPWTAKAVDDICIIKSMHTDAINHEPANDLLYTGSMVPGRASLGSWTSYGMGSLNSELPMFCVLHAERTQKIIDQPVSPRLWNSGYLPGKYTGVTLRTKGDPILYLKDLPGIDRELRRKMLDGLSSLNHQTLDEVGDPEIQTRIQQYEMAYRMQVSVPELTDLSQEPESTYELYGEEARKPGTFSYCTLMARRLAERGVRFTQIFHRGWDQHLTLPRDLPFQCGDVDRASYALIKDLKRRGLLDDTLVIWGGEFGRTFYSQGALTEDNYGRDHHPRAFSMWLAGAGVKGGMSYGETDELGFNIITPDQSVHIRDLQATILERCGFDHNKLTFKSQGLDQRLTGVEPAKIVTDILDHSTLSNKHVVSH